MTKKLFISFLFLVIASELISQSAFKQFSKLSRPEKIWVVFHPFKAKKALLITRSVLRTVDSVKVEGRIGVDMNGGKLDAFRHAFWMASLTTGIGSKKALKLGKAHEKGNYLEFRKGKLEDSILPDSVSTVMDLHNNLKGAESIVDPEFQSLQFKERIFRLIETGKLLIIKKDKQGNYLYCDGTFIDTNVWYGKWDIPKCLIASDKE